MNRVRVKLRCIGERIKKLREHNGMTQKNFADTMNVSLDTVKNWEQGWNYPEIDMIAQIANYFHCDFDYLFGSQNDPRKEYSHIADMTGLSYNAAAYLEKMAADESYSYLSETLSALLEQMQKAEADQNDSLLLSLANCIYTDYFPDNFSDIDKFKAYRQSDIMDLYSKLQNFINERRNALEYRNP